ncbi:hypothetical protein FRC12_015856 [Ceratobasidium sp. 428]|nr:hypothetical protein FRC12_015856 [Ceratobasidium sp. 428]
MRGDDGSANSAAYSPDGAYIVSGSTSGTISIWDAYTGQLVGQPLKEHGGSAINSVAYSPDGAYIVSASDSKTIRIWSMKLILPMVDVSESDSGQPQLVHSLPTISEPRILCNLGCRISCPHIFWTLGDKAGSGWIYFNHDRLIWVPEDLREVLLLPENTALMSPCGFLELNLDPNKLGEHWHEYFQPRRLLNHD